ncbi:MAG: YcaO-like family protein [Tatlockia sp.]|nr:YcaO-like family protein [Tatlockia sp.]
MISTIQSGSHLSIDYKTRHLMHKMLSPVCGLVQEIGFIKRNKFGARILTAGADITGVHTLLNRENPGRGAYHTGGGGIFLNEPIIKSLGETIERYAQLLSELTSKEEFVFSTYEEMTMKYDNVLSKEYLDLYTAEQLNKENFPYDKFNPSLSLSWVKVRRIDTQEYFWIPAQFLFVGYHVKKNLNEPWYSTAVTTGTAAHTDQASVLLNSILEIIQIDSAMGHWYSNYEAPEIVFDKRTRPMQEILRKYDNEEHNSIRFFWLRNPDLLGFSIACVLEKPETCIPRVSIGLGASTTLNDALYKAYLEAIGVSYLNSILILKDKLYNKGEKDIKLDNIYDIDTNVAMYGKGYNYNRIAQRFNGRDRIVASEMDADIQGSTIDQFKKLLSSFSKSGKELLFTDLSNIEAKELGFYVSRLWCKDTLSLCFPSAPPINHPRFIKYGGLAHDEPHPYP